MNIYNDTIHKVVEDEEDNPMNRGNNLHNHIVIRTKILEQFQNY